MRLSLNPLGWAHSLWRFLGSQLEPLFSNYDYHCYDDIKQDNQDDCYYDGIEHDYHDVDIVGAVFATW